MLGKLLLAFIVIPLIELFLLVWLAQQTSLLLTVGLVILTGIIGSLLARAEGVRAWRRFRIATAEGRLPGEEIQDGLMIAFAAALLLTPGLLTDTLGFALLIPRTRRAIGKFIARRWGQSFKVTVMRGQGFGYSPDSYSADSHATDNRTTDNRTVDAAHWSTTDGTSHPDHRRSSEGPGPRYFPQDSSWDFPRQSGRSA